MCRRKGGARRDGATGGADEPEGAVGLVARQGSLRQHRALEVPTMGLPAKLTLDEFIAW
jgi:hypothetical protein